MATSNGTASIPTSLLGVGSHTITATFAGTTGWQNSTSQPLTQTVTAAGVPITLRSSPPGLTLQLGTTTCTDPCNVTWTSGSTISVPTPQMGATGTRYVFAAWSDGDTTNPRTVSPASGASFTANFTTQYQLTSSAGTGGSIRPNGANWYQAGTQVLLTPSANAGYSFQNYSFTGVGASLSGNTVTLATGPASVTANFSATMVITSATSLPAATQNSYYSFQFTASGGVPYTDGGPPYHWSVAAPPGGMHNLSLSGLLDGTPTIVSLVGVSLRVTVSDATNATISGTFTLVINPQSQTGPQPLNASCAAMPSSTSVGQQVTFASTVTGGSGSVPYFFTRGNAVVSSGTGITNVLFTPTSPGTFTENLSVRDGTTNSPPTSCSVTVQGPDFSYTITPSQTVTAGTSATYSISQTGGVGFSSAVTYSLLNPPAGVSASPISITGTNSGTLTVATTSGAAPGTQALTVTGVPTSGTTHNQSISLIIQGSTVPGFTLSASPTTRTVTAAANTTTSYTITAVSQNNFHGVVTVTTVGLPAGPTLSSIDLTSASTGSSILTIPTVTQAPTVTFSVTGTNGSITAQTQPLSLTVNPEGTPQPSVKEYIRLGGRLIAIENQ
jgi:Bacterial Ig-like domain (group 3)/Divergent InlB B-repeat domain